MKNYQDKSLWSENTPTEEDDEIIWVSKSELKRDAEKLKDLGEELINLGKNALDRMPLDEDLRASIELAQRIKKEGRRRQIQLIGKMLRARDPEPIYTALEKIQNKHNQQIARFHKLEQLREELIEQGDQVLQKVIDLYPTIDRQQLRTLVRQAQKERADHKPPKVFRQIFQYLKEADEAS